MVGHGLFCRMVASLVVLVSACQATTPHPVADRSQLVPLDSGATLFVRLVGNGPQVVIIPGRHLVADGLDALAGPARTLVLYDMRNRGRSVPVPLDRVSVEADLADLDALRRHLGYERVALVGYSYMGMMTALYASRNPGAVERLVQIGPAPRKFGTTYPKELTADDHPPAYPPDLLRRYETLSATDYPAKEPVAFCRLTFALTRLELVGDAAKAERVPDWCDLPNEQPATFRRFAAAHLPTMQALDFTEAQVRRIVAPVLTIHGTWDRNAPYGSGREWAGTLPNARLLTIEGAGHNAWLDDPRTVVDAIDEFLKGRWPADAVDLKQTDPTLAVP